MVMGTNCVISIHALLAESDAFLVATPEVLVNFYPRSPCGERPTVSDAIQRASEFLSTLSLRRATPRQSVLCWPPSDFYPRSPCGERQRRFGGRLHVVDFYPRSPCGERRGNRKAYVRDSLFLSTLSLRRATNDLRGGRLAVQFLSTLSLRRATPWHQRQHQHRKISIHALLAESDRPTANNATTNYEFLSTLSLRRATPNKNDGGPGGQFLSTLSLRRATTEIWDVIAVITISIHALLAESDSQWRTLASGMYDFYPRSPCGERRAAMPVLAPQFLFLSTLSLRRATCGNAGIGTPISISIHALLAESDYFHYL